MSPHRIPYRKLWSLIHSHGLPQPQILMGNSMYSQRVHQSHLRSIANTQHYSHKNSWQEGKPWRKEQEIFVYSLAWSANMAHHMMSLPKSKYHFTEIILDSCLNKKVTSEYLMEEIYPKFYFVYNKNSQITTSYVCCMQNWCPKRFHAWNI